MESRSRKPEGVPFMRRLLAPTLAALALSPSALANGNWPHWRGPTRDGGSTETGLPVKWSTTENVRWKIPMPDRSGSTPNLWEETIFLNGAEAGELHRWALDRKDGSRKW